MKKVLLVIPSLEQGGGQKFVMDLAKGIDRTRFQVRVLVYYKKSNSVFDKFAEENGIDTVYLDKKVGLDFKFFKQVKKAVKEYNPDIIHTNLDCFLYLFPVYRKEQLKLHTIHTLADKENVGMQKITRFIAYKIFKVTPVGISETVSKSIQDVHNIKADEIPIVYNAVDCKRYDLPKQKDGNMNLVSVGTIYYVKNYSFLVECFSEICKKTDNVHLTILGDGVLRSELENQISSLGLNEKVTITGVVGDVENYLAKADIYVASSVFEGLPISMLEAMSAGLPIISTNVGGVSDIVKNGENGILVESGDKDGYIAALSELISNEEERMKMSERSKELSVNYDIKNMVEGYERIYERG